MGRVYLVEISISFVKVKSKPAPTCREVLQFVRDEHGAEYYCIDNDEEGCWNCPEGENSREMIQDPHHRPSSVRRTYFEFEHTA
jgi:hypothetical protein